MNSFFLDSAFAGVAISLIAYMAGTFLKKKLKLGLFNPLLISIICNYGCIRAVRAFKK